MDREYVSSLLDYDPDSGVFTWKRRGNPKIDSRIAGKRAGNTYTGPTGYQCRRINIEGRLMYEHRLAWILMSEEPLPKEIDHLDRDGTNNRWENIVKSDRLSNGKNLSMKRNNSSGVTGVYWSGRYEKWIAELKCNYRKVRVGTFSDLEEAKVAIAKARKEAGFSESHGESHARYMSDNADD